MRWANPVEVVLSASNIPLATTILVTATPQSGTKATATNTGLTGTLESSTASLNLTLTQTNVLIATASFALVASLGTGPVYAAGPVPSLAEGEEVTHVRIAANLGGSPTVTYITASGIEYPMR